MQVVVGSQNKAKVKAVKSVFSDYEVKALSALSNVSKQPLTNEETRQGAINRAYYCFKEKPHALCIGLEGGVTIIADELYLCSWGALVVGDKLFTAGGTNIALPSEFRKPLQNGIELSELMESYTKLRNVRHNEGAIGIFTNKIISRSELFAHIVMMLKGQAQFDNKIN